MYDPTIARFTCLDPIADQFAHVTPYNYAENRPIDGIDLWGLQWISISGVYDPGMGGLVTKGKQGPLKSSDWETAREVQKKDSGGRLLGAGGVIVVTWAILQPGSCAAGSEGYSAGEATNSKTPEPDNYVEDPDRMTQEPEPAEIEPEGVTESTTPGSRRKNRLPDRGDPNTIVTNEPETTTKKYGKDGWVQKEYNSGHDGENTPEVEKSDHVHDYKPNPYHPEGRPTRQPARPPKKNEYSKDKYKTENGN